jgi:hypothetical protein
MPIGASLHIGLNAVDPKHYSGWDGQLTACEFDANDMQALAKSQGFTKVTKRLTKSGDTQSGPGRHQSRSGADSSRLARGVIFVISKGLCPRASHRDAATARVDN